MRIPYRKPDAAIPDSSMADVAFLLLVFFLVTAVFSSNNGVPMSVANAGEPAPGTVEPIVVKVDVNNVRIDCRAVGFDAIDAEAAARVAAAPASPVVLYAAGQASYGSLVRVYDGLVRTAGIDKLAIATGRDIRRYIDVFGVHPFESHCAG